MDFVEWLKELWKNNGILPSVLLISTGVLVFSGLIAFFSREKTVYYSLLAVLACSVYVVLLALETDDRAVRVCMAMIGGIAGVICLVLQASLSVGRYCAERKKRRAEVLRQLKYTLPDKENSFVRTRLNTSLHVPDLQQNEGGRVECNDEGEYENFRMEHARKLFEKLEQAPLSTAERLQTKDAEALFRAYLKKERWTSEDIRLVNELFSYLLKLAAKYSV